MKRYLLLYARFLEFSFSRGFEFRFDFIARVTMDLTFYAIQFLLFHVLYLHAQTIGGFDSESAQFFVAAVCLTDALIMCIFADNMWTFAELINKGELDYYLTRPVSSLFFVSVRRFAASSFVNLLCAVAIFAWLWARTSLEIPPARALIYFWMLFQGSVIFYCLNMLLNSAQFWMQSSRGILHMAWTVMKLGEKPDTIYPGRFRWMLLSILPVAMISSVPTRVLLGGDLWTLLGMQTAILAIFLALNIWVWNRGLRVYSSASS